MKKAAISQNLTEDESYRYKWSPPRPASTPLYFSIVPCFFLQACFYYKKDETNKKCVNSNSTTGVPDHYQQNLRLQGRLQRVGTGHGEGTATYLLVVEVRLKPIPHQLRRKRVSEDFESLRT